MTAPCGCCEGVEHATPIAVANRPGLPALAYRVGTHATFFETLLARLSNMPVDVLRHEYDADGKPIIDRLYPLSGLTARTPDDPAIALLDAWATVADVLTFYQERIANEGYLRTATERRSILELARLVGYRLRPGVASSVYLAYTLEPDARVEIPAGSRVQSLPGPGELPQSFETSEALHARAQWNNLQVRLTRPQRIVLSTGPKSIDKDVIYFSGTGTNLRPGDPLLFLFGEPPNDWIVRHVKKLEPDAAADRTRVELQELPTPPALQNGSTDTRKMERSSVLGQLIQRLSVARVRLPGSSVFLEADLERLAGLHGDFRPRLLSALRPELRSSLYQAWADATVTEPSFVRVYAFRVKASLFGHNVPKIQFEGSTPLLPEHWREWPIDKGEGEDILYLDNAYDQIGSGSNLLVLRPDSFDPEPFTAVTVTSTTRAAYGITAKTTRITMRKRWWRPHGRGRNPKEPMQAVRQTVVYAQSEELKLAQEPLTSCVGSNTKFPESASRIELAQLHAGLQSGRWVIVSGERADIKTPDGDPVRGVRTSELAMISGVTQDVHRTLVNDESAANDESAGLQDLPGDKTHSFLELSTPLAYCYKRDTVTIYGNVVKATHGEMRAEVLGSGDGSKGLQEFALRQSPLTYLPAPTPAGAASTLELRVNGVEWREVANLAQLGRTDRSFITKTDDQLKSSAIFGDGERGARLPTGVENVRAVYRTGIGRAGNVKEGQISLLATRPLGVKGVINPQRASGGADPDSREQARRNVPLAVIALDRLVSVQDYADFARSFAGIGKASAAALTDGHRQLVYVTIAAVDDAPIDVDSELYRNLLRALHEQGDPYQPIELAIRELLLLVISANVRILPEYEWESIAPRIRATLLERFGFERRELAQNVFLSEVISTMQEVEGVDYVDADTLTAMDEEKAETLFTGAGTLDLALPPNGRITVEQARCDDTKRGVIHPAQIAFLSPDVSDTLILNLVD